MSSASRIYVTLVATRYGIRPELPVSRPDGTHKALSKPNRARSCVET